MCIRDRFKLRFNPLYYQLAKRKVRLWEFVTSLKLDEIIVRWIKRKEKNENCSSNSYIQQT